MIAFVLYILMIILNFSFPRSKVLLVTDFLFMWILMGWNHSVADYSVYLQRYNYPEIYGTMEQLYVFFQDIGKSLGLNYDSFLIVMTFVFLLIRYFAIFGLSRKHNCIIALYMLFPFIMDITQLRMFYASSIVLLGLFFYKKYNYKKRGAFVFCVFNIIATLIHAASVVYFIIPLAVYIDKDKIKKYSKQVVAVVVVLYGLLFSGGLYWLLKSISGILGFGTKFIETAFAVSMAYKVTYRITYMIEIALFFVFMNYLFKKMIVSKKGNSIDTLNELTLGYKCNYSLLLILPLAWFSGDIYRVQHGILVFFYAILVNGDILKKHKVGEITWKQIVLALFLISYIFLFLIGNGSLYETVLKPVFFKNELMGF